MNKLESLLVRLENLYPKYIDLSLSRINRLLKKLEHPHLNTPPCIHIAGTNGKGSTLSFLKHIMIEVEILILDIHFGSSSTIGIV